MYKKILKNILLRNGYKIHKLNDDKRYPVEFDKWDIELFDYILNNKLTMVSESRLISTFLSTKYILENNIPGDLIECGVWRGGNSIGIKYLLEKYKSDKKLYLFDTFKGMTEPTKFDVSIQDEISAREKYEKSIKTNYNEWCFCPLSEVKENFIKAKLSLENIIFIEGPLEDTLLNEKNIPGKISLLRLDTDWYESTRVGIEKLFPKLSSKGITLIDDYGHWGGAKKAIDDFFGESKYQILNSYVDYTGRMIIKF